LTDAFGSSLRLALTGGGNHQSFGVPSSDVKSAGIDLKFLDEYGRAQWESILHFVVSTGRSGAEPTAAVQKLLEAGSLITGGRRSNDITQAGFSFLLQEVNAQVWTLLLLWLQHAQEVCLPP
jgi:transcription initiation factor TFIIH subunit 4